MRLHKTSRGFLAHISTDDALYIIQTLAERIRHGIRVGAVAELKIDNEKDQCLTIEVMDAHIQETKKRKDFPPGALKES